MNGFASEIGRSVRTIGGNPRLRTLTGALVLAEVSAPVYYTAAGVWAFREGGAMLAAVLAIVALVPGRGGRPGRGRGHRSGAARARDGDLARFARCLARASRGWDGARLGLARAGGRVRRLDVRPRLLPRARRLVAGADRVATGARRRKRSRERHRARRQRDRTGARRRRADRGFTLGGLLGARPPSPSSRPRPSRVSRCRRPRDRHADKAEDARPADAS